jgi:hypothetical protein
MSLGYWFLLTIGLGTIFWLYKKSLASAHIESTLSAGMPAEESKKSYSFQLAMEQKRIYKNLAYLVAIVYLITITNIAFNYTNGWYVFALIGFTYAYGVRTSSAIPIILRLKMNPVKTIEDEAIKNKNSAKLEVLNKSALITVGITIVISLNWAYQVQKNQSEAKLFATNEVMKIVGTGWCSNFWDIDANPGPDGDYIVNKSGGWPCISVGSVSNIYFTTEGKNQKMCFNYSLTRSDGPPSQSNSVSDYDFGSTCALDSWLETGEGWDEDSLWSKVRKEANIEVELNKLQTVMCQYYYYRMSYEEQNVYC